MFIDFSYILPNLTKKLKMFCKKYSRTFPRNGNTTKLVCNFKKIFFLKWEKKIMCNFKDLIFTNKISRSK